MSVELSIGYKCLRPCWRHAVPVSVLQPADDLKNLETTSGSVARHRSHQSADIEFVPPLHPLTFVSRAMSLAERNMYADVIVNRPDAASVLTLTASTGMPSSAAISAATRRTRISSSLMESSKSSRASKYFDGMAGALASSASRPSEFLICWFEVLKDRQTEHAIRLADDARSNSSECPHSN